MPDRPLVEYVRMHESNRFLFSIKVSPGPFLTEGRTEDDAKRLGESTARLLSAWLPKIAAVELERPTIEGMEEE